jgi:CPA2 family monovalent cation:H+ antiporter-2
VPSIELLDVLAPAPGDAAGADGAGEGVSEGVSEGGSLGQVQAEALQRHWRAALQQAGAAEVVPEAIEGSLMLASHALALVGVPMRRVIRIAQEQRDARYSLLRGYFHGEDDSSVDELEQERLVSVTLPLGARAIGHPLSHQALHAMDTRVVNLRRRGGQNINAALDPLLEDGDTLVLSGKPEPLAKATQKLLKG